MKIREFLITIVVTIILGACVIFVLNGFSFLDLNDESTTSSGTQTPPENPTTQPSVPPETQIVAPTATALFFPQPGSEREVDLDDVLLLYNSSEVTDFDTYFCLIAEFYGLACKKIPINEMNFAQGDLQDEGGNYFKLIAIDANTWMNYYAYIDGEELSILKTAVETEGVNLLLSKLTIDFPTSILGSLTNGSVRGIRKPVDTKRDWNVSSDLPEITKEFTGQAIQTKTQDFQEDFSILINETSPVTPLISGTDDDGAVYTIFAKVSLGKGSIFLDAGDAGTDLATTQFKELYYAIDDHDRGFAQIVPTMLTIRYALDEEVWHNNQDYANLTLDDPALIEPFSILSYPALLQEMQEHNFHTTIAMHPGTWQKSQDSVVRLFRINPEYYSLVQHGNNGDGYEFYKYSLPEEEAIPTPVLPARPLAEQELDIIEGLTRLVEHRIQTGINFGRVMIFPMGISPEDTLVLLKKYNYLATVNAQEVPLEATPPSYWDYGMYQANMDYGNFATITRRPPATYEPLTPQAQPFIFDLFIDKPALFYSHAYEGELFDTGLDAFNEIADQINQLTGEVEWQSLAHILSHLYLEKLNDDGSVDVKMYTNHLNLHNESTQERTFHVSKEEILNVPIQGLTVNGYEYPYAIDENVLTINIIMPAGTSCEILITYGE